MLFPVPHMPSCHSGYWDVFQSLNDVSVNPFGFRVGISVFVSLSQLFSVYLLPYYRNVFIGDFLYGAVYGGMDSHA